MTCACEYINGKVTGLCGAHYAAAMDFHKASADPEIKALESAVRDLWNIVKDKLVPHDSPTRKIAEKLSHA